MRVSVHPLIFYPVRLVPGVLRAHVPGGCRSIHLLRSFIWPANTCQPRPCQTYSDTAGQDYEPYGGLALSWVVFGSSGHVTRPTGGALRSFTKCASYIILLISCL